MLLSVYEVAAALGIEAHRVYYQLRMSRLDGAYKVMNSWRLTEDAVKELYESGLVRRTDCPAGDSGCGGLAAILADLKAGVVPGTARSGPPRIQGRRRRMEHPAGRPRSMAGKEPAALMQLWLFEEFAG